MMFRTKLAARLARASTLAACLGLAPGAAAWVRQGEPAPRAARAPSTSKGFREVRPARADVAPEAASFEFELKGFSYRIRANGNGQRTKGEGGSKTRRFNLRLEGRDYIETIYYAEYEGDLLVACNVGDGDAGAGLVFRLEQPSMRALWKQQIPAFNVGEPLRDGGSLYVTGIGFIGRLDLRTGEYVWQHDDLDDARRGAPGSFNSFEVPELDGDTVLFRDRPVYNPRKTVVVKKRTGEIIRIE